MGFEAARQDWQGEDDEALRQGEEQAPVIVERLDLLEFAAANGIPAHVASSAWNNAVELFIKKDAYEKGNEFYPQRAYYEHIPLHFTHVPTAPEHGKTLKFGVNPKEVTGLEVGSLQALLHLYDSWCNSAGEQAAKNKLFPFNDAKRTDVEFWRQLVAAFPEPDGWA